MYVCIKEFRANERLVILGDLNARVGEEEIDGIISGKSGVPGTNTSEQLLIGVCAEND